MEIDRELRFGPGQLVRHRKYGYRGVVAEFDMTCRADEMWYYRNQAQPPRNQPWYHVLVDGSATVTYAAQTSLIEDDTMDPVAHPLVTKLFIAFENGRYERNDLRLRGWQD
jgi:heat shock protein HspQ